MLLYSNSVHSFCHICSIALTAVQHFQKYTATCTVSNLAVWLHIGLQLNTKVQAMVHTCCVADSAAQSDMKRLPQLYVLLHTSFSQVSYACAACCEHLCGQIIADFVDIYWLSVLLMSYIVAAVTVYCCCVVMHYTCSMLNSTAVDAASCGRVKAHLRWLSVQQS